jgi:hypothetical protein
LRFSFEQSTVKWVFFGKIVPLHYRVKTGQESENNPIMDKFQLIVNAPFYLVALCLLVGLAYALLLYYKVKNPWPKPLSRVLAVFRFLIVSLICLFLLAPLVRQIKRIFEKPAMIVLIDNSSSISLAGDTVLTQKMRQKAIQLQGELAAENYRVELLTMNASNEEVDLQTLDFDVSSTDLDERLTDIKSNYDHLAGVVLLSDGIYNVGRNPTYTPYGFPVYTVGIGDTTDRPDAYIQSLRYNKLAYQGNRFPLVAEVMAESMPGAQLQIQVFNSNRLLSQKTLEVKGSNFYSQVDFLLDANEKGVQKLDVQIVPLAIEISTANNEKTAFVDVVEGKESFLIVAEAPHPDIKALTAALTSNQNYEVDLFIEGLNQLKEKPYNTVIFFQVPSVSRRYRATLQNLTEKANSVAYFIGNRSDVAFFNSLKNLVYIQLISRADDASFPIYNENFSPFSISADKTIRFSDYPPVEVPFANYNIYGNSDILLYQRIGNIDTQKPLLVTGKKDGKKTAVFIGEDIYKWRMREYAQYESQEAFDDLFTKLFQFLSTREDKRRFRVYPVQNEFFENESVVFENEVYNDIYERIYDKEITLTIVQDSITERYVYQISATNSQYRVGGLEPGIYEYSVSTTLDGESVRETGTFVVKNRALEATRLKADFNLLRNLSANNSGAFYLPEQVSELSSRLQDLPQEERIRTKEELLPVIHIKWLFFLLLLLASVEWFIRKYYGGY